VAWAGLAETYVVSAIFGLHRPNVAFPAAKAAAERALALDDTVVQAHTALGEVHKLYEWDWIAAEDAYRRAIDIDPSYAAAHQHYAHLLVVHARDKEALTQIEIARECDPVSPTVNAFVSAVWLEMRRYREAVDAALAGLELDSQAPLLHLFLGRAYAKLEDARNAIASFSRAADLSGRVPLVEAMLGFALARSGQRAAAERILKGFEKDTHLRVVSPMDVAQVCLGERERVLTALEDAFDARSPRMINLNDPFFSELADEARYRQLLAHLRLSIRDG
jgi:tetratricopeptide (TPR) repeat protein